MLAIFQRSRLLQLPSIQLPAAFFHRLFVRMGACIAIGLAAPAMAVTPAGQPDSEELTERRFQQLHTELQPQENQLWRSIPWKITMLDAQATAAKENKPIFIWAMDGHPLGCT